MVCAGNGGRGEELRNQPWQNWAATRSRTIPLVVRPRTRAELVAIVTRAEVEEQRVKAVGSSMSYSEAAIGPHVGVMVETHLLSSVLNGTRLSPPASIIPFALKPELVQVADSLVHVESGIKLHALNCFLAERNLAMPTLGGAFTQSIVGAMSTGTHGSDVDRPPIADHVQAIHLVGPGGKEWWIEREGERSITDPARMEMVRAAGLLCADASVVYEDRMFNAVLVSLGRMGIVYSVVIRAVPAVRLLETREERQWSEVAALLRAGGPEAPVLQLTRVPDRMEPARFVDVALTPFFNRNGDRDCIVQRRWETTEAERGIPDSEEMFNLLCREKDIGRIVGSMIPRVHFAMHTAFGFLLLVPFVGNVLFGIATATYLSLIVLMTAIASGTTSGADLAQALARISTLAASLRQSWIVSELVSLLLGALRGPYPEGSVVGDSFKVMTGQLGCPDLRIEPVCMRQIDGLEFAFDASAGQTGYLDFVEDISTVMTGLLDRHQPAGAILSLRFMPRSEGLLAMQQFPMNCTVEIFSLRGLPGSEEFLRRVQRLAMTHGGIPHWGLIHELNESQVVSLYGENLTNWRRVLTRLIEEGGGVPTTFSTQFSVRRGLEPLAGCGSRIRRVFSRG